MSGSLAWTAAASDDVGVTGVQFFVTGEPLGVEDAVAPFAVSWDVSAGGIGAHMLTPSRATKGV